MKQKKKTKKTKNTTATGARWMTTTEEGGRRTQEIGYRLKAVATAICAPWTWLNQEFLAGRLPKPKWDNRYWSRDQLEEIRKTWQSLKTNLHRKVDVAKFVGVTEMILNWAIRQGNIPAPTTTRGDGVILYYTSKDVAEIKRFFERLRVAQANWVLLEVGLIQLGCTHLDAAYARKKPELLPKPVCIVGKSRRNTYYRLKDLEPVAAIIKLRTIKPRKTKSKETN